MTVRIWKFAAVVLAAVAVGCGPDPVVEPPKCQGAECDPPPVTPKCGDTVVDEGEECDDGNDVPFDGCELSCRKTPVKPVTHEVVECPVAPPAPTGGAACDITAGNTRTLITGTVLLPGKVLRNGQVLVDEAGKIACVDCDCTAKAAGATAFSCPETVITPGLINNHEHITYANNRPAAQTGERYEHRHDWRTAKRGHTRVDYNSGAKTEEVTWGELRFIVGGSTSMVGAGSVKGFVRNLDSANQEGLGQPAVDSETFALGDSNGFQLAEGCTYRFAASTEPDSLAQEDGYFPHVAEGIDREARNEFVCLSSTENGARNIIKDNVSLIHAIALNANDVALMAGNGTSLVWSPRSNISLYGDTAPVTTYDRLGALITLGTDWIVSGSMNVLRELQCAAELNEKYYGKHFSDEQLWLMVTRNAALATATDDAIGVLKEGLVADLAIFRKSGRADYEAVVQGHPKDVALVLRGGKVLYGDDALVQAVASADACDVVDMCGLSKRICAKRETGKDFAALLAANSDPKKHYPLFFCEQPEAEPSCLPTRTESKDSIQGSTLYPGTPVATDTDGDGIDDLVDNCPATFNPVRPVDDGKQGDVDGDGVGDACDVCPINAGTSTCTSIDPADLDQDGIPADQDNCPAIANAGQEDEDKDGKGDLCDKCPAVANPGAVACPGTVYDVKSAKIPAGETVSIDNMLVTGVGSNGFFAQVKDGDAGFQGADYSGIFIYTGGEPTVAAGDRIRVVSGRITVFRGQIELDQATIEKVSSGEAAPAPVKVLPGDVALSTSPRAKALEGVLVQVENVDVTNIAPAADASDFAPINEFMVTGDLRIDDWFYKLDPFASQGETFASIAGVLALRNNQFKVLPRSMDDFVAGAAKLVGFNVPMAYVRENYQGPGFPTGLEVMIQRRSATPTMVNVTSLDTASLEVVTSPVEIPANALSAPVQLRGVKDAVSVTLEAELNGVTHTAAVRVLALNEAPTSLTLTPAVGSVGFGLPLTMTLSLDIPAPAGGLTVDLALAPVTTATVPAQVTVPENERSVTFIATAGTVEEKATLTATAGALTATAEISVIASKGGLVINEVDYDQLDADIGEFVELYNGSGAPVDLTGLTLVFVNGNDNKQYLEVALDSLGTLAQGEFAVVANPSVQVAAGAKVMRFTAADNNIQNGGAKPDALGIYDTAQKKLIDALSYEGEITAGVLNDGTTVSFVEGTALPVSVAEGNVNGESLIRSPNGMDTDDASKDWKLTTTPTPGAINQ